MSDDELFMALALEEAQKAYAAMEVPIGAVLVGSDGALLSRAHNTPVSSCDPTAHAEILVLRKAAAILGNYRIPGTMLYVTVEPCPMCLGAMLHARVERLVYGARDPKWGAHGSIVDLTRAPFLNHHIQVVDGIRSVECKELLQRFFRERRQMKKKAVSGEVPKWP